MAAAPRRHGDLHLAPQAARGGGYLSGTRYLVLIFLANAAGFGLVAWALQSWGDGVMDWSKTLGVSLLMGITAADLVRRLASIEPGEVRSGFGAYRSGTRWIVFLWGSLAAAFILSAVAVRLFG